MVRPANFARASETVADNSFQQPVANESFAAIGTRAVAEFDCFVELLREAGVELTVVEDTPVPVKPDAIFPNNWFSTHADGTLVTYPTYWPQRRLERRDDVVERLRQEFQLADRIDLSGWEAEGQFLESTGSLLLDRGARIAYACLSQRCSPKAVHDWCERMDYKPITFHGYDLRGAVIYHTNVMMALGTTHAVVCLDAVTDPVEKSKLTESLMLSGKRIVGLSLEQVDRFAGNMLEVVTPQGPLWVMSTAAYTALDPAQVAALLEPGGMRILHTDLGTIERYGGGSARCMVGEIFLPPRP
ncbi:citrulline utilization hydrolase CtlX [Neolewinella sp.]|uniref:citrulline utilization hydrolase CtlX n=1 Tax=Neolewinella sp. TaxID=2993543 RepID=UPI003B52F49A